MFWPNAIQFIEITRERWTVLTLEGDQSSAMPKFTDSPLEESGFELLVPLARMSRWRAQERVHEHLRSISSLPRTPLWR